MTEHHNFSEASTGQSRQTACLSRGLESLVDERPWISDPTIKQDYDFDVVIVGSGYGAAVAAAELSGSRNEFGRSIDVCLLERGKEYLPGAFPSRQADLAGYVRFMTPGASRQRGVHDGLYDIRWSEDAVAVVASGLGGGSLINAGVMEMPLKEVFLEARWPSAIRNDAERLGSLARQLRPRLGASQLPSAITDALKKTSLLGKLAEGGKATPTRITVAAAQGPNSAGVVLNECLLCGDCATGCNNGAKDSLDLNLLDLAQRAGAQIVTGATVLRLNEDARGGGGWVLHVNHTDNHLRDRQPIPFQIRARRVILAAGTLGSTEILLRSRGSLRLSAQLGQKFSANGDMLVTAYGLSDEVNAVADETTPPRSGSPPLTGLRKIGPTITSMIDLRTGNPKRDLVVQDLAVPGALRRLFEEVTTTFDVLNQLGEGDFGWHRSERATDDAAINPEAVKKSLVLAMIGRDDASGELSIGDGPICDNADGLLTVRWPELRMDCRFDDHHRRLTEMMRKAGVGGRVVSNPLWRPFSEDLERLFGRQRGPLVTVHPLGGCAMGDNVRQGVADHCGRVFDAGGPGDKSVHQGLVVLDGSIVPTSLGINPALTIAVLAFRAITQLKQEWKITGGQLSGATGAARPQPRPVFATPSTITNPKPTLIELTEQVRGRVKLRSKDGRRVRCELQLTLTTQPTAVTDLIAHSAPTLRGFEIASGKGNLTILRTGEDFDSVSDMASTDSVALQALVSGKLRLFALEPSNPYLRTARALSAWIVNRGLRDAVQTILQSIQERLHLRPRTDRPKVRYRWYRRAWNFTTAILRVCSRAGAVRLIEYDLKIDKVFPTSDFDASLFDRACIRAVKRLTYGRAASPFTQLLGMSLETFPQMRRPLIGKLPVLQLNKRYLARQQIPLLRVVDQQDGAAGLIDCLALALYLFRVTVQRHALSFRRPDAPSARTPQRLPGRIPNLPEPEIDWLTVDSKAIPAVRIRLTRYNGTGRNQAKIGVTRPVLLIHGYSASGTTFAHPAVPGNLAQTLCEAGRDVWVLDLRCSAGLPSGTGDWPFEVMAEDIPLAVDHVAQHEKNQDGAIPRVDIVAHCMGAAMFSMAVLGDGPRQKRLHEKVGRVVFSQVGPVMMLSRTNVLAAYIMRYARQFLSSKVYTFSPQGEVSVAGQLLDRALAAMSMPHNEYKRENPFWPPGKATPWAGTRNRMDALYGRTFSLKNISKDVLDRLDDFFGPVSIETVSQVIHFAASNTVTDQRGINRYAIPSRISRRFDFPLMSIHGEDNGLADVATLALMCNIFEKAGVPHLNAGSDAAPASLKSLLIDIGCSFSRMLTILGIRSPADRLGIIQSQREITRLINSNHADLIPGRPSYLTWRIEGHGHQDCLIGKHAPSICGVIATYLAAPDQTTAVPRQASVPISRRKRSSSCQAIAPAFGVRARILKKAAKIRLQACDSSGRGPPLRAMIVPVRQEGTRFAFDGKDGAAVVPGSYKLLSSAGVCICKPIKMRKRKRESNWPWFFEIPYGSWPSHASAVLVLLLYDQAEGIGGNSRPPRPMLNACDQVKSPIAKAICEALSYDNIETLRGGLVSGSLIDQRPKERITFALASCLYPSDILNHMPATDDATVGPADASLLGLSNLLGEPESPTLLLLAGDQIYADATAGLFDPKVQDERYRIPHERRGESRGSKAVVQRLDLDIQMMLDDHEIQDNWAPNDPEPNREDLKRAKLAYFLYERATPKAYADIWHKLNHRGLPFFLADARTEREARTARNWRTAKIMQPRQFRELCRWLAAPKHQGTPKFVMTASALLPRRLAMTQPASALGADAWDGYPLSRSSLLQFVCDNEIKGLVFLSGDEHLSSVTRARVSCDDTGKQCILHSIHSSGLFSPYPFANGSPDDFIANDSFAFSFCSRNGGTRKYRCEVETQFFPGDGFVLLSAEANSANWALDVRFHNEAGLRPKSAVHLRLI